jgi:hypothetical protein
VAKNPAGRIRPSAGFSCSSTTSMAQSAKIELKSETILPGDRLSSLELNFQEVAMENKVKPVVGAAAGAKHDSDRVAETREEWVAPNLRKVDIAEITANGVNVTPDGVFSS